MPSFKEVPITIDVKGARKAAKDFDNIVKSTKKLDASSKGLTNSLKGTDSGLIALTKSFKGLIGAWAAFETLKSVITIGAEFEYQMDRVKAISGATEEQFKSLTKSARELGASTQFTASEVAKGQEYLALAGMKTNQIISALPGLIALSTASGEDFATMADIVSDQLSALGLHAADAGRMADSMAFAMSNANTNVSMLGIGLSYASPVMKTVQQSMETTITALSLMANESIKGSKGGTALRMAMIRLAAPPRKAAKAIKELGVVITDESGNFRDAADIFEDLNTSMSKLTAAEKLGKAAAIFGVEATSGMITLINKSKVGIQSIKVLGETVQLSTTKFKAFRLEQRLAQKEGKQIVEAMNVVGTSMKDVAIFTQKYDDALNLVVLSSEGIDEATGKTITKTVSLREAFQQTGQTTNEIIAILAVLEKQGISTATTTDILKNVLFEMQSPSDATSESLAKLGVSITDLNSGEVKSVTELVSELSVSMANLTEEERLTTLLPLVGTGGIEAAKGLNILITESQRLQEVDESMQNLTGSSEELAGVISENLTGSWKRLTSALHDLYIEIFNLLAPMLTTLVDLAADAVTALKTGLREGIISTKNAINAIFKAMFTDVINLIINNGWEGAGKKIIDTLIKGVKSKFNEFKNSIKDLFGWINKNLLPHSDAKTGGFSHLTEAGQAIMTTMATGVDSKGKVLSEAVNRSFTAVTKEITSLEKNAETIGKTREEIQLLTLEKNKATDAVLEYAKTLQKENAYNLELAKSQEKLANAGKTQKEITLLKLKDLGVSEQQLNILSKIHKQTLLTATLSKKHKSLDLQLAYAGLTNYEKELKALELKGATELEINAIHEKRQAILAKQDVAKVSKRISGLQEEIDLLGLSNEERKKELFIRKNTSEFTTPALKEEISLLHEQKKVAIENNKVWGDISNHVGTFFDSVVDGTKTGKEAFKDFTGSIKDMWFKSMSDMAQKQLSNLFTGSPAAGGGSSVGGSLISGIAKMFTGGGSPTATTTDTAPTAGVGSSFMNSVKGNLGGIGKMIAGSDIVKGISSSLGGVASSISSSITGITNSISSSVSGVTSSISSSLGSVAGNVGGFVKSIGGAGNALGALSAGLSLVKGDTTGAIKGLASLGASMTPLGPLGGVAASMALDMAGLGASWVEESKNVGGAINGLTTDFKMFVREGKKGIGGTKTKETVRELDDETSSELQAIIDNVGVAIDDLSANLNVDLTSSIDNFSSFIGKTHEDTVQFEQFLAQSSGQMIQNAINSIKIEGVDTEVLPQMQKQINDVIGQVTAGTFDEAVNKEFWSGKYTKEKSNEIREAVNNGISGFIENTDFSGMEAEEINTSLSNQFAELFGNLNVQLPQETFEALGASLGSQLSEVSNFISTGEGGITENTGFMKTFRELSNSIDTFAFEDVNKAIEAFDSLSKNMFSLKDTFESIGFDTNKITTKLINSSGGFQQLNSNIQLFSDKFIPEAVKKANQFNMITSDITDVFSELELQLPTTRDNFRQLVEGLDTASEAGANQFNVLIGLSESMDLYYSSIENGSVVSNNATQNMVDFYQNLSMTFGNLGSLIDTSGVTNALNDAINGATDAKAAGQAFAQNVGEQIQSTLVDTAMNSISQIVMQSVINPMLSSTQQQIAMELQSGSAVAQNNISASSIVAQNTVSSSSTSAVALTQGGSNAATQLEIGGGNAGILMANALAEEKKQIRERAISQAREQIKLTVDLIQDPEIKKLLSELTPSLETMGEAAFSLGKSMPGSATYIAPTGRQRQDTQVISEAKSQAAQDAKKQQEEYEKTLFEINQSISNAQKNAIDLTERNLPSYQKTLNGLQRAYFDTTGLKESVVEARNDFAVVFESIFDNLSGDEITLKITDLLSNLDEEELLKQASKLDMTSDSLLSMFNDYNNAIIEQEEVLNESAIASKEIIENERQVISGILSKIDNELSDLSNLEISTLELEKQLNEEFQGIIDWDSVFSTYSADSLLEILQEITEKGDLTATALNLGFESTEAFTDSVFNVTDALSTANEGFKNSVNGLRSFIDSLNNVSELDTMRVENTIFDSLHTGLVGLGDNFDTVTSKINSFSDEEIKNLSDAIGLSADEIVLYTQKFLESQQVVNGLVQGLNNFIDSSTGFSELEIMRSNNPLFNSLHEGILSLGDDFEEISVKIKSFKPSEIEAYAKAVGLSVEQVTNYTQTFLQSRLESEKELADAIKQTNNELNNAVQGLHNFIDSSAGLSELEIMRKNNPQFTSLNRDLLNMGNNFDEISGKIKKIKPSKIATYAQTVGLSVEQVTNYVQEFLQERLDSEKELAEATKQTNKELKDSAQGLKTFIYGLQGLSDIEIMQKNNPDFKTLNQSLNLLGTDFDTIADSILNLSDTELDNYAKDFGLSIEEVTSYTQTFLQTRLNSEKELADAIKQTNEALNNSVKGLHNFIDKSAGLSDLEIMQKNNPLFASLHDNLLGLGNNFNEISVKIKSFKPSEIEAYADSFGLTVEQLTNYTQEFLQSRLDSEKELAEAIKQTNKELNDSVKGLKTFIYGLQGLSNIEIMQKNNPVFKTLHKTLGSLGKDFDTIADSILNLSNTEIDAISKDTGLSIEEVTNYTQAFLQEQLNAQEELNKVQEELRNKEIEHQEKMLEYVKDLNRFADDLLLDESLSTLTDVDMLKEAQSQYNEILQKSMMGDEDALSQYQAMANSFLSQSREVNASTDAYTSDFNKVQSDISIMTAKFGDFSSNNLPDVSNIIDNITRSSDENIPVQESDILHSKSVKSESNGNNQENNNNSLESKLDAIIEHLENRNDISVNETNFIVDAINNLDKVITEPLQKSIVRKQTERQRN